MGRQMLRSGTSVGAQYELSWPKLALKIYSVTKSFPGEETYSLVDQMRRAAISVGMNLMEGAMRLGTKEYRQFVGIAAVRQARSATSSSR